MSSTSTYSSQTTASKLLSDHASVAPNLSSNHAHKSKFKLKFCFVRSFSGQTWPRDPVQRVRLEKWCRTHLTLAPGINYKVISWPFPGLGQKLKFCCHPRVAKHALRTFIHARKAMTTTTKRRGPCIAMFHNATQHLTYRNKNKFKLKIVE